MARSRVAHRSRIGFDYFALLCALRATGANPNAPLVLLAYAATAVIALVPLTPADSASSKRVSADSSS